jgi:uncharacterized membrane protein
MSNEIPVQLGKLLIIAGVILVVIGVILAAGSKYSFLGLGRLPGDIVYKGRNFRFYFPIVTSIVLSVVLTLFLWLISFFTKR